MNVHYFKLEADDGKADMFIFGAADLEASFQLQPTSVPGERLRELTLATDEAGHIAVRSQVALVDFKD